MNTTAGSWCLVGAAVPRDSTVVEKLRKAGAIILGKANLTQWSGARCKDTSNGWSSTGGQTLAAYHENQDPSGSSSGSCVSVDQGLAAAALGTDTHGSILCPAQRSNVVGIRPTVGLTSRHLVIPVSEYQDTVGPIARTVKDAARVLQAIAGPDPRDAYTLEAPPPPDYLAACSMNNLQGSRIGVPWNVIKLSEVSQAEIDMFETAIAVLKDAGALLVDADFPKAEEIMESDFESVVLQGSLVTNLQAYLRECDPNPNHVRSLAEVRTFTREFRQEEYPEHDTENWDEILDTHGYVEHDQRVLAAYQRGQRLASDGGLLGALDKHKLTAIILPVLASTKWAAVTGTPVVTVPLGFYPDDSPTVLNSRKTMVDTGPGVPIGLSFMGRKWSEADLIGLAYEFEQRTMARVRRRPIIVPSVEIGDF